MLHRNRPFWGIAHGDRSDRVDGNNTPRYALFFWFLQFGRFAAINMASRTSLKLVLSSEVRLIDLIHMAAEKVAQVAGFDADESLNLGLAVREAAINAIIHGNGSDPNLEVHVTLTASDEGFSAHIADEGEGFDPDAAPDPTKGDNLLATSGRGLLLMRSFVDDIVYSRRAPRGMEVILRKRRTTS